MGMLGEFKFLKKHKEQEGIDLVIVSDMKVVHVLRYYLYSAILKIPIATNFVEMASSMQHRTSTAIRINDYILDKWCIKLFDGALPISDRLMAYYAAVAPTKPRLKLPILCDFKKFDIPATKKEPYFLYCGSFRFKEVRDFIIQAYKLVANDEKTKLYMIISGGSKSETALLEQELNSHFKSRPIKLFANIPYAQLVQLNTNALALLIPLRPTVQDASRFPHKIGEYLASGNPVITTNIGEVRTYFEDGNTALVADNYSIESFAEKMKYVQENPERAASIGSNGRALGLKEFDFRTHGEPLKKFLREIT